MSRYKLICTVAPEGQGMFTRGKEYPAIVTGVRDGLYSIRDNHKHERIILRDDLDFLTGGAPDPITGEPEHAHFIDIEMVSGLMLSDDDKRRLYRAGLFEVSPPPVTTVRWSEDDWILYIGDSASAWWRPVSFTDETLAAIRLARS